MNTNIIDLRVLANVHQTSQKVAAGNDTSGGLPRMNEKVPLSSQTEEVIRHTIQM